MKENDFKEDLKIDLDNLDAEAAVQPELYFKWASFAREAREAMDMSKLNLDITEAKLSRKVRETPAGFGINKVTEGAINEAVKIHPDYEVAYKSYIKTRSESDILYKAQESMEQKKRSIELLVQLHGREYFAGPSVPHTTKEMWEEVKKKKGEKVHDEMIDRTKKKKKGKIIRKRKNRE